MLKQYGKIIQDAVKAFEEHAFHVLGLDEDEEELANASSIAKQEENYPIPCIHFVEESDFKDGTYTVKDLEIFKEDYEILYYYDAKTNDIIKVFDLDSDYVAAFLGDFENLIPYIKNGNRAKFEVSPYLN